MKRIGLIFIILITLWVIQTNKMTQAAPPAAFLVNSTADTSDANPGDGLCKTAGNVCTIRAAVEEANALGGSTLHSIVVPVNTYVIGQQITITANILIIGANAANSIIDGGDNKRIFYVTNSGDVTFNTIRIQNGNDSVGGAIYNLGSVRLAGAWVEENTAPTGGAIYSAGTLTVDSDSQFRRNSAFGNMTTARGGAIYNAGTLTIDNSDFISNTVFTSNNNTSDAFGGAIYNVNTATITNTTLLQQNSVTIQNGNIAAGGGIYNSGGTIIVNNSILISNEAKSINSTESRGGAINNSPSSTLTVENSLLSSNEANGSNDSRGGGIYNNGDLILAGDSCIFTANKANPVLLNDTGEGGGVYNISEMQINDCAFNNNIADDQGGGLYNTGLYNIVIEDTTFLSNKSQTDAGGGIANNQQAGADLLIINSTFTANEAGGAGGAIAHLGGELGLESSDLSLNAAMSSGGGLWASGAGSATINHSTLSFNLSNGNGGGIGASINQLTIQSSDISTNTATIFGGGLYTGGGPTINIVGSAFFGNRGIQDGGGIHSIATLDIINSTFSHNETNGNGGGIYGAPLLSNVTIVGNRADDDEDGSGSGGGLHTTSATTIQNTILAENIDNSFTQAPDCNGNLTSNGYNLFGTLAGCNVTGDTTGNIVGASPLLDNLKQGVYASHFHDLLANSPAINGGNIAGCTDNSGAPLFNDQRTEARTHGPHCDIGAVERFCTIAPVAPEISGVKSGFNVVLNWTSHTENTTHEVWRSSIPNFEIGVDPAQSLIETPSTIFTHVGILFGLQNNVYYRVQGKNLCGTAASIPNEQLGVFIFELTPGT